MLFVLLTVTLFLLSEGHEGEVHDDGDNGELCTENGKSCLAGIPCINNTCVCPPGTKGDGMVECVHVDDHVCIVKGHYQIQGFGQRNFVRHVYPCPTRLAEFTVNVEADDYEPRRRCTFDIQGSPVERHNTNSIMGLAVRLTLAADDQDDGFGQPASQPRDLYALKFNLPNDGYEGFFMGSNTSDNTDDMEAVLVSSDNSTHVLWRGINVVCTFDAETRFAILAVPECRTRIKIRPHDMMMGETDRQHTPAISIQVPGGTEWNDDQGAEHSLCGKASDRAMKNALMAERLRLDSARTVALYYTLLQGALVPLFESTEKMCDYPAATVSMCPEENRVMAIRHCGPLMTSYSYRSCLVKEAFNGSTASLLQLFDHCLKFFCEGGEESCLAVRGVVTKFCTWQRSHKLMMTLNDYCRH